MASLIGNIIFCISCKISLFPIIINTFITSLISNTYPSLEFHWISTLKKDRSNANIKPIQTIGKDTLCKYYWLPIHII